MREKAGYGTRMRYEVDFLEFVKDDIHWFTTVCQTTILFMFVIFKRKRSIFGGEATPTISLVVLLIRHFINAGLVYNCYFRKGPYELNKCIYGIYFLKGGVFTAILIFCYLDDHDNSLYTAPYLLYEIILGVTKFVQIFVDKHMWQYKLTLY